MQRSAASVQRQDVTRADGDRWRLICRILGRGCSEALAPGSWQAGSAGSRVAGWLQRVWAVSGGVYSESGNRPTVRILPRLPSHPLP